MGEAEEPCRGGSLGGRDGLDDLAGNTTPTSLGPDLGGGLGTLALCGSVVVDLNGGRNADTLLASSSNDTDPGR